MYDTDRQTRTMRMLLCILILHVCPLLANAQKETGHDFLPGTQKTGNIVHQRVLGLAFTYPSESHRLDLNYQDNSHMAASLRALLADRVMASLIDSIRIEACLHPRESRLYSHTRALLRAQGLEAFIMENCGQGEACTVTTGTRTVQWRALERQVQNDTVTPCRSEVLQILALDRTDRQVGELVRRLNAGIPYSYISLHMLPKMADVVYCTVYMRPLKGEARIKQQRILPEGHAGQTGRLPVGLDASKKEGGKRGTGKNSVAGKNAIAGKHSVAGKNAASNRKTLVALKTNLLFDAALMPNLEIEMPVGKRWSLNGEYIFPWWTAGGNKYCLRILMGSMEARCWTGKRKGREALTGHFIGIYAATGKYDLQWKEEGYQSRDMAAIGISYGWAARIAEKLHIELSVGVGLMHTGYRHYRMYDNYRTPVWQENGNYLWMGPAKAKVALVWMITRKTENRK